MMYRFCSLYERKQKILCKLLFGCHYYSVRIELLARIVIARSVARTVTLTYTNLQTQSCTFYMYTYTHPNNDVDDDNGISQWIRYVVGRFI